jgi:outer membrane receptor protein involved in Fe transport
MSARASFDDALSITRGRHNMKFGFSTELDHKTEPGSANYGNYSFNDDVNNPLRTNNGCASMLLGYFTSYTELTARVDKAVRHWQTDAFAQDNWRVTSRLTLDYGLRVQHAGSQYEVNDSHTASTPPSGAAQARPSRLPPGLRHGKLREHGDLLVGQSTHD